MGAVCRAVTVAGRTMRLSLSQPSDLTKAWDWSEVIDRVEEVRAHPNREVQAANAMYARWAGRLDDREAPLRLALDMPTGLAPIGGLPKDLDELVVPPLRSLTRGEWLGGARRSTPAPLSAIRRDSTGDSGLIMSTAARSPDAVRRARRGVLMSEALAESGSDGRVDLDGGERLQILDTLITSIAGAYAHLPAKRAAYASDPVQALTLLRRRAADLSDTEFNRAVSAIITGLRDAHTRYIGPSTLRDQVAVLPFLVEQYGPESRPRYLVSKINTDAVEDPEFQAGVELEAWNGAPFARAVENHADLETGGRPDSRRPAPESLTFELLGLARRRRALGHCRLRTSVAGRSRSACRGGS
jgi:hypothetical protein